MARNSYTMDEITLCAYAAIYDANDFGGVSTIQLVTGRSLSSIRMKIKNLAALLDKKHIKRFSNISGLTGTTTGEDARETNWEDIQPLIPLSRDAFRTKCLEIRAKRNAM